MKKILLLVISALLAFSLHAAEPVIRIKTVIKKILPDNQFETVATPTLVNYAGQEAELNVGQGPTTLSLKISTSVDGDNITINSSLSEITTEGQAAKKRTASLPPTVVVAGQKTTIRTAGLGDGRQFEIEYAPSLLLAPGITVDFQGGTLGQLITAINKSGPTPFNLVVEKKFMDLPVPAFSVRNAGPENVATALDQLLVGYVINTNRHAVTGEPVFVLTQAPVNTVQSFYSYNLAPMLEVYKTEDIVSAIRAAWELDPRHNPDDLRLKFHPETKLLLVAVVKTNDGDEVLRVVDNVMQNLNQAVPRPKR